MAQSKFKRRLYLQVFYGREKSHQIKIKKKKKRKDGGLGVWVGIRQQKQTFNLMGGLKVRKKEKEQVKSRASKKLPNSNEEKIPFIHGYNY